MRVRRWPPIGAGGQSTENLRLEILTLTTICQRVALAHEPGEECQMVSGGRTAREYPAVPPLPVDRDTIVADKL
jgi:hypothetical protein